MIRTLLLALGVTIAISGAALADPIEGQWKTEAGSNASFTACGDSICITLTSGQHEGKQIGKMKPAGDGKYAGTITDPADDKTYKGKATLAGDSLKMGGCILGGLICQNQTWTKL